MEESREAAKELEAGNYGKAAAHYAAGTAGGTLEFVPGGKFLHAIFAGIGSRLYPRAKQPLAEAMARAGRSPDEIWQETGLGRLFDGQWVHEISDKGFRLRPDLGQQAIWGPATSAPLHILVEHPGLWKAYPELADFPSVLIIGPGEKARGKLTRDRLLVRAPDLETAKLVMIHEIRHLIQTFETHPPGGDRRTFEHLGMSPREAHDRYWRLPGEVDARNASKRLLMSERERRLKSPERTEDLPRNQQISQFNDD
jgi:hypothetical protein